MDVSDQNRVRAGVAFALAAFLFWGVVPLYFKLIGHVRPVEVIAHRVVWTMLFVLLLLPITRSVGSFVDLVRNRRALRLLAASASLIAINWVTFVWAVDNGKVLETSLGYFINPLVNVVLGMVFLDERLRRAQTTAVLLAASGVLVMIVGYGSLPWVSLVLPLAFGFYGLVRKRADVDSLHGLLVETLVLTPVALGYFAISAMRNETAFLHDGIRTDVLLVLLGPLTVFPLGCFAAGARRINLSTLGFIQYLAPSITFLLAVFAFHEPFGVTELVTFGLIWTSLLIFSVDGFRLSRAAA